jgi:hypothetical protein
MRRKATHARSVLGVVGPDDMSADEVAMVPLVDTPPITAPGGINISHGFRMGGIDE